MSVNIDTVYQEVLTIANKNQIGNYLDSIEFNRFADIAQREWFNEGYLDFGSTQSAMDNFAPLMTPLPSMLSNGQLTTPTDYMHLVSLSHRIYDNQSSSRLVDIEIISDSEYRARSSSPKFTPSNEFPVCIVKDGYMQIYPNTISRIEGEYIKQPTTPVWGFTVVNSEKVYDSTTSVDFEIPIQHTEDIVQRIVRKFAFEIRDNALASYESKTNTPVQ